MQLYRGMDIGTAKLDADAAPRRAAPPARRLVRARAGQRRGVPGHGPGRRSPSWPARDSRAGPGRGLRAVRAGGAGPAGVPRHRRRRSARGWSRSCAEPAAAALHARLAERRPGGGRDASRRATRAASSARSRSWSSPAGRSRRRCPTTATRVPRCRSGSSCREPSSTSGSPTGSTSCGERGLVGEVRRSSEQGLREGRTASRALGYAQVLRHLAGEWTEDAGAGGDGPRRPGASPGVRTAGSGAIRGSTGWPAGPLTTSPTRCSPTSGGWPICPIRDRDVPDP